MMRVRGARQVAKSFTSPALASSQRRRQSPEGIVPDPAQVLAPGAKSATAS
jgi:hypothetical protein